MNDQDRDRLLEQNLSGDLPYEVFRAKVLRDSTVAFVHARRSRARWRLAALRAAAVLVTGVSFFLGRCSVSPAVPQATTGPVAANAAETVAVPGDLVVWLQAARFFKQLGMEDRVALAYDRASKLVPYDSVGVAGSAEGIHFAGAELHRRREGEHLDSAITSVPAERVRSILAQSFGG